MNVNCLLCRPKNTVRTTRTSSILLPPSLQEWLSDDHLAYFVSDIVDSFDLREIEVGYEDEARGAPRTTRR